MKALNLMALQDAHEDINLDGQVDHPNGQSTSLVWKEFADVTLSDGKVKL